MQKTLRSRIAAVAAVAVGAAVLSAAPAFAGTSATPFGVTNAETVSGNGTDTVSATQVAGANNYVTVGFTATNGYNETYTVGTKQGYLTVSGGTFASSATNATVDAAATTASLTDSTSATAVNVLTPTAGTITVKFVVRNWSSGVATDSTKQTITITVGAATKNVYASSKVFLNTDTSTVATADSTASALTFTKAASSTAKARVTVSQYDAQATPAKLTSGQKAVTVSIAGAGALGTTDSAVTGSLVEVTGTTDAAVYVFSDGRAGVATLTITVGGVSTTKTVTFYGAAATYKVTQLGYSMGTTQTAFAVGCVQATDAAGVTVPLATSDVTLSTTTTGVALTKSTDSTNCASGVVANAATTAVTAGSVSYKAANSDASVSASGTFTVAGKGAVATITADKSSYAPGEKITYTITVKDAKGNVVPDDAATASVYAMTTNVSTVSTLPTAASLKNGVQTFSVYAPVAAGTFTLSVKFNASTIFDDTATTGLGGTTQTVSVKVLDDTTAIDAVKADVVKTQAAITALTTTITAIQTAITALVASTTATLTLLQSQILKIMAKLKIK